MKLTGRKQKLTPMQIVELRAWHKARASFVSNSVKARELGISVSTLRNYVSDCHKFKAVR